MAIGISTATQNAMCAAAVGRMDAGAGPGTIQIRTGTRPVDPNAAASGTLLATFTCNDPAFGTPSAGAAAISNSPQLTTTGVAAGDAGHFRALDSTGAVVMVGSVSDTGGSGDLKLNTITVSVGVSVAMDSGSITQPAG